eukprot:TRINITY_DN16791_c0_g1_i1.p1 TRINITY_DN16791_c0_g1~~TRINITY_DN16791_c0_g1_i1.p1  ORF type:complete len:1781 (+),score=537.55 TRINITY_DN16791_c0_g1_i1:64-5343(+)
MSEESSDVGDQGRVDQPLAGWGDSSLQQDSHRRHPSVRSAGCCGKGLYLAVVGATLVIACAVMELRAETEVEDLIIARAEFNKVQQAKALGILLESAAAVLQDSEQQLTALSQLAHSLNRQYLRGSTEVQLVHRPPNCALQVGGCNVRLITQPRNEHQCPTPEEADVGSKLFGTLPGVDNSVATKDRAAPQCDMHQVLPVARVVLAGESGSLRAQDYTMRDVVYAYRPVNGTSVGLILKQDLDEVLGATDLISRIRWYGGLITYACCGTLLFLLLVLLRQVEQGKGVMAKLGLCVVAMAGVVTLVWLMSFIDSQEEGEQQQLRETGDGAAILLAGYQSLFDADFGASGVYDSVLRQWIGALNSQLDPNFEAALVRTQWANRGNAAELARYATVLSTPRRPCSEVCLRGLASQVVTQAVLHPMGKRQLLYDGIMGYAAAGRDEDVQRAHAQLEFGWMVKESYAVTPYDDVTDDLWKRTGALIGGYAVVALLASLFACKFLPTDSGGMASSGIGRRQPWQRLSWAMPLVFVAALGVPMLVLTTASTTALSGIGTVKQSFLTRSHGDAMIDAATVSQALTRELESNYRLAIINSDTAGSAEARIETSRAALKSQFQLLAERIEWLEGDDSAAQLGVEHMSTVMDSFFERTGLPAIGARTAATLVVNETLKIWTAQPDEAMLQARTALDEMISWVFSPTKQGGAKMDPRGRFAGSFFELGSLLWDLEILIRQEVVRMNQDYFTQMHQGYLAEFRAKRDAMRNSASWSQLSTAVQGQLTEKMVLIESAIEQEDRDFNRFHAIEMEQRNSQWSQIIQESLHSTVPMDMKVLSGDSQLVATTIPASDVFDVVTQQLQRIASSARIHVMRNVYVGGQIDLERDRTERGVWCGVGAVLVTWLATFVTFWLYVRVAQANVVANAIGVVDYPQAEIRDFGINVSVIMVLLLLELTVIWQVSEIQFDELSENSANMEHVSRVAGNIADWSHQMDALISSVAGYTLTGENKDLERLTQQWARVQELERIGEHPITSAPDQSFSPANKTAYSAAFSDAVLLADELRRTALRRTEYDSATPTYTYDTLRLLIDERIKDNSLDSRLKQAENMNVVLRDSTVASFCAPTAVGPECESKWEVRRLTAARTRVDSEGTTRVVWEPQLLSVEANRGYRLVFENHLPEEFGEVSICVGSLTSSSAVWKVQTVVSDWDVPYTTRVSVTSGQNVSVFLYLVQPGQFLLHDDSAQVGCGVGQVGSTVQVTGPEPTHIVDVGLPLLVQERLCDARRDPRNPAWTGAARFDVDLVQTGGYRGTSARGNGTVLRLVEGQPYRVGIHGFDGPGCAWVVTHTNKYCQTDLRKDISSDMPLAVCQATAALDPECSDVVYSNGTACRCVRKGELCDFLDSAYGMNISRLECSWARAVQLPAKTGLNVAELSGHLLWSSVEDHAGSIEVPYARGIELRSGAQLGARTYMSLVPVDRGLYPIRTLSPPHVAGTHVEISRGCHEKSSEAECSSVDAVQCLWNGETCVQNYKMISAMSTVQLTCSTRFDSAALQDTVSSAFDQGRLSDNHWHRLGMRRAAQIMHSNHDAYVISSDPAYRREADRYAEFFKGNLSQVTDEGSGLLQKFETWQHALDMEDSARFTLSRTGFLEDVFLNVSRTQTLRESVSRQFRDLQGVTRPVLSSFLEWSEHNTRFVFWSCTAVCWFFTAMAALLLHRLSIVVTVSNEYCFRNVPQLTPRPGGDDGAEITFDDADDWAEEDEEQEGDEDSDRDSI